MTPELQAQMEADGWTFECESPLEIRHTDGSFATMQAARALIRDYENTAKQETRDAAVARVMADAISARVQMESADELAKALSYAYHSRICRRQLAISGTFEAAAKALTSGAWRQTMSISWDRESLSELTEVLTKKFGGNESDIRETLMNCGGSFELARRVLSGQPLLLPTA